MKAEEKTAIAEKVIEEAVGSERNRIWGEACGRNWQMLTKRELKGIIFKS